MTPRLEGKKVGILLLTILLAIFLAMLTTTTVGASAPNDCTTDVDGDGFCAIPEGNDCNDNNAAINPGAAEICGDGVDNNCDAYSMQPGLLCPIGNPLYCPSVQEICSDDDLSLVCPEPSTGFQTPDPEGWAEPITCVDNVDNNCDGFEDELDLACASQAETCDGYDNDYDTFVDEDFPGVGGSCTAGVGICERNGASICTADGSGTTCTAVPGNPHNEGPGNTCSDGLDNDCDGTTDAADFDCAPVPTAEICDGIDNNLDSVIDEGFDVGASCSVGQGVCQVDSVKVCTADGAGTQCNAFPLPASTEGPSGLTCSDSLDNDCDGTTDLGDVSCNVAASTLQVTCALPYLVGRPGRDCNGKHIVQFYVTGGSGNEVVRTELLALSSSGELLGVLPDVGFGEEAHLASRLSPGAWKWATKTNSRGNRHEVFAPVPMLHVVAQDGDTTVEAYCSNIPYLDVIRPSGQVVSVSSGDATEVSVALPNVDVTTLLVWVDGVDILVPLGIDPATDFPGGPFNGTVTIDGELVEVEDLVVSAGTSIADPSANTLTMRLSGLGGGGHIIYVDGEPGPVPSPLTAQCLRDDIADAGTMSALEVTITSPAEQAIISPVPVDGVPVQGEVRHGRAIASLKLNGASKDVSGQVFTPGDGMTSADEYVLNFVEPVEEVALTQAIAGSAPLGTLQRGSNKVVADASDDVGTRAFDDQTFAIGEVLSPLEAASLEATVGTMVNGAMSAVYTDFAPDALMNTEVPNAFVAGLEESAVDAIFDKACPQVMTEFRNRVTSTFTGLNLGNITIDPDCSCAVTAPLVVQSISFAGSEDCDASFAENQIDVTFDLPDATVVMAASNSCEVEDPIFGTCIAETVIDIQATTKIIDPSFTFAITEEGIETNAPPTEEQKTFVIGQLRYPGSLPGDNLEDDVPGIWENDSELNCWGAAVCSFFEAATGFLVSVFTFGLVEPTDLFDFVNTEWELADFQGLAGANQPDAVGIGDVGIDEQEVEGYGRASFAPTLEDVEITPLGLTASFAATFDTQVVDPSIDPNPGAALSPAPAPVLPQDPGNGFIVLADDTMNQLFASLAQSGGLETTCQDTSKTIGDLLPDCETLTGATDLATAAIQGYCHAIREDDCESLTGSTILLQATEQGVCHGASGDDCNAITGLVERVACNNTPLLTVSQNEPVLFCSKQSIPPQMTINDSGVTPEVETSLLLNDLSVTMAVDRGDPLLQGGLEALPSCFSADATSAADCNIFSACLDLTLETQMSISNDPGLCSADETAFIFSLEDIDWSGLQAGVVCGAATQTDDGEITGAAASDATVDEIANNAEQFTPPFCAKGLDLNGLLSFTNPRLISVETGGPDTLGDYFGITGDVTP